MPVQETGGPGVVAGDSPVELAAPPPKEKKTGYVLHISPLIPYISTTSCLTYPLLCFYASKDICKIVQDGL